VATTTTGTGTMMEVVTTTTHTMMEVVTTTTYTTMLYTTTLEVVITVENNMPKYLLKILDLKI
jgi:hypothetical protein